MAYPYNFTPRGRFLAISPPLSSHKSVLLERIPWEEPKFGRFLAKIPPPLSSPLLP